MHTAFRTGVVAVVVLLLTAAQVDAQFNVAPGRGVFGGGAGFNPVAGNPFINPYAPAVTPAGIAANQNLYGSIFAGSPYGGTMTSVAANPGLAGPAWGWGPWGSLYDPFGGYLRGSSEVIRAQGQLLQDTQQAYLMNEQVRREKIENRRRMFDEWLYERNNTPTLEDERERMRKEQLRRSKFNPNFTEITSGKALNDLLDELKMLEPRGVNIPEFPLDDDVLKQVNVTSVGRGGPSAAMLKEDLKWPVALNHRDYKAERDRIEALVGELKKQALLGKVDPTDLKALKGAIDAMNNRLKESITEVPQSQYMDARRFINNLTDAYKTLERPDAKNFLDGTFAARGRTVPELIKNMAGLNFAAAVPGNEAAYVALHRALASAAIAAGTNSPPTAER
jgi:hypothetical protein